MLHPVSSTLARKFLLFWAVELDVETELADLELVQAQKHLLSIFLAAECGETVAQVDALVVRLEWYLDVNRCRKQLELAKNKDDQN